MLLKHSLPILQSNFRPLLPLSQLVQIRASRLKASRTIELLLRSIVRIANTFDASLAVIITAAEGSDGALTAAEGGGLARWGAKVVGLLRVEVAFDVFDAGDAGEGVVDFGELVLSDAGFEFAVVDVGRCPEFDVEFSAHCCCVFGKSFANWAILFDYGSIDEGWCKDKSIR
jgi:hypothetical protein